LRYRLLTLACLLALPLWELAAHAAILLRVPDLADYRAAASFIRSQLQARDLITAAPSFIDPILRWQLGDRMPLAMAGRHDDAAYERLWVLSIRDRLPADAPRAAPELARDFGRVRVLRYALPKSPVLFDFVAAWPTAEASIERAGKLEPCPLRTGGVPRGGGLGRGVLMPVARRFECDARVPWLFISDVVLEDLDNRPRHCLWQHPQGAAPITLTFRDVPLGDELVFHAGIYYEHERMREGGPVEASIVIDGQLRATFHHTDGDGFRSLRVATREVGKPRADVSVSVRAPEPRARSFCWAATTRAGAR
jgi:hypothetical protein